MTTLSRDPGNTLAGALDLGLLTDSLQAFD